ncbi:DUF1275 family protein [Kitasatospora camelliae]|uniref:DUF1275 family protein n=1 Tax=Kitasatospora camelliae TaxID=3156397 RepID=A0AAU8K2H1_9ACTN
MAHPSPAAPTATGVRGLPGALVVLTVVSGLLDAVGYLGLGHVFAANMTGNVVVVGFAAVGTPGFSLGAPVVSVGAFLAGAVGAGRAAGLLGRLSRTVWVRGVLAAEAVLLAAATAVASTVPAGTATLVLVALLAVAMGLRNGAVRSLGVPDVTTTVLTGTLTALAAESTLAGGGNPRWGRRVVAVAAMLAGAAAGAALVDDHGPGLPLLLATLLVTGATLAVRPEA